MVLLASALVQKKRSCFQYSLHKLLRHQSLKDLKWKNILEGKRAASLLQRGKTWECRESMTGQESKCRRTTALNRPFYRGAEKKMSKDVFYHSGTQIISGTLKHIDEAKLIFKLDRQIVSTS